MKHIRMVAFKGVSFVSKGIKFFTRSGDGYSHVAVLLEDGETLLEAWPHNKKRPWKQWTDYSTFDNHTKGTPYEIWRISVTDEVYNACMSYYIHHADVKTPYDYAGVIGFIFKKVKDKVHKLFCSEYLIYPISKGCQWDKVIPSHVSPQNAVEIFQVFGGILEKEGKV
jgi:hypothetical protein